MPIPYFPHSGRRPHFWKLRSHGLRELLIQHRWGLRGAYAEKRIGRSWVMQTRASAEADYVVYRFQRRDDVWSEIAQRARQEEAETRRAAFAVVGTDDPPAGSAPGESED